MKDLYFKISLKGQKRLLNLLNKNPASETYGCFDRSYWLHRKVDLPASTAQMSMLSFSYFYKFEFHPDNQFYKCENVLCWIMASLKYTLQIQNSDGSYDEWYPNERGWGGPTGYILSTLSETYLLMNEHFSDELKSEVKTSIRKSVDFLLLRDEHDVLTNHYAIVLNAITQANLILKDSHLEKSIQQLTDKLLSLYSAEGWSLEYDGCDLGYNLGTLNFLVDVYKISPRPQILLTVKKCLHFLAYFISPENTWIANLSSRHTIHNYYYALEFWSHHCEEAHPLLLRMRQALIQNHDLLPTDQEDHYIHYRMSDYIKANLNFYDSLKDHIQLPYQDSKFEEIEFPESGFIIKKINNIILWISCKRGGALTIYKDNKCLHMNNGVLFKTKKNRILTNLWQSSQKVPGTYTIESDCVAMFDQTFKPFTFLLFRAFLLTLNHAKIAYYFKRGIRQILITFKAKKKSHQFVRTLKFTDERITIEDIINSNENIIELFSGGNFHSRFVPQGHYFQSQDLHQQPQLIPVQKLKKNYEIKTTIHLANEKVELCVE